MSLVLPAIVANTGRSQHRFVLLQSSFAQSCIPILRHLISTSSGRVLLICYLYSPDALLGQTGRTNVQTIDHTADIPGYSELHDEDSTSRILNAVKDTETSSPLTVVIDSVDTLSSDTSKPAVSTTYNFLAQLYAEVTKRGANSRLILHVNHPCPLTPLLCQSSFSATLAHLRGHPPALLTYIASSYSTPPEPLSPPERFWSVFSPIADRQFESERLLFGQDGQGHSGPEIVVEIVTRGGSDEGRRRGVNRTLEGWVVNGSHPYCEVRKLETLKSLWTTKTIEHPTGQDPAQKMSFNLNLTPEQQRSRAQVPLPYAHDNAPTERVSESTILYDPDSADDLDDDDPDEDLDI